MTRARLLAALLTACTFVLIASGGCDPVHNEAIDALGPEAPGVSPGPKHRPGQPCLTCHTDGGPGNPKFVAAGTVYQLDTLVAGVQCSTATDCGSNQACMADKSGSLVCVDTRAPDPPTPLEGASVKMIGDDLNGWETTTNEVGNFYVLRDSWQPVYPMTVSVDYQPAGSTTTSVPAVMNSKIYRDSSCADCHTDPKSVKSTGHIYFASVASAFPK